MKRIGIIGGLSFESTSHYYEAINQQVNQLAGGLVSADLALRSVNFAEYHKLMQQDDWDTIASRLTYEIATLDSWCDCDYVAIASNTMHKVADQIEEDLAYARKYSNYTAKFVHIGDCVAEQCLKSSVKRVALIGTRLTMQENFMKEHLATKGLEIINDFSNAEIERINYIIFNELCHGIIEGASSEFMEGLCQRIAESGEVEGIILGCTEIGMVLKGPFSKWLAREHHVSLFDTTQAHINKLANLCLSC